MDSLLENIWICLVAYATIQGILLAIIFPTFRRGSKQAKWLLSAMSLLSATLLGEELIVRFAGYDQWPHLIFAFSPLWYCMAPLLFLYIQLATLRMPITWRALVHLIPAMIVVIDTSNFYMLPGEVKLNYIRMSSQGHINPIHNFNFILFCAQSFMYLAWATHMIVKYRGPLQEKREFWWIAQLVTVLAALAVLGFLSVSVLNVEGLRFWFMDSIYFLLVAGFLLNLFLRSVQSPKTIYFIGRPPKIAAKGASAENFLQIEEHIRRNQPYRDPDFTIQDLSLQTGYSRHQVSKLVKQWTGLSFQAYINQLRITDAKEKLHSPLSEQFTIQSIAAEAGFASLATFYRVFKKLEGKTPKSFMQQQESAQ